MADEAFALSPISARAVQPGEEDYDAISQAFMETSRGRWFLGEYAKRNRNADTRMVLDAVARIEQTLAEQKQPVAEDRLPEDRLPEALAAIRSGVDEARAAAAAAIDELALEQHLAPVRKGIRVIKEISWRWREIGADARICDLIDSQLVAIEASCEQIASADPQAALSDAFDRITQRMEGLNDGASLMAAQSLSDETTSAAVPEALAATSAKAAIDAAASPAKPGTAIAEAEGAKAEADGADIGVDAAEAFAEAAEASADATAEDTDMPAEAADAFDEAILDMVALEMAAADSADAGDMYDGDDNDIAGVASPTGEPIIVRHRQEPPPPVPAAVQPSQQPPALTLIQPSPQAPDQPQPSLGSTLIANGIVRRPNASDSDPLAPIRRMSQAEKIAFFS